MTTTTVMIWSSIAGGLLNMTKMMLGPVWQEDRKLRQEKKKTKAAKDEILNKFLEN